MNREDFYAYLDGHKATDSVDFTRNGYDLIFIKIRFCASIADLVKICEKARQANYSIESENPGTITFTYSGE